MRFDVITLLPEMFGALNHGLVGLGLRKSLWSLHLLNPRQFTEDAHHTVDDRPFGGGDGMIMLAEPLAQSVASIESELARQNTQKGPVIYLSPHGVPITTQLCEELAQKEQVTLVCGRYGGVDQRFINRHVDLQVSVGDTIVSGGEFPAMMLMDSVIRLLPGVLGNAASPKEESFFKNLLEAPQFTRPRVFDGQSAPDVLFSGHHREIEKWRRRVAILVTRELRPDLLAVSPKELSEALALKAQMSESELAVLGLKREIM